MKIVDLKDMPGANLSVANGMDSVSKGLVYVKQIRYVRYIPALKNEFMCGHDYPYCHRHGSMNRVSKDGIYRCLQHGCHVGCYMTKD